MIFGNEGHSQYCDWPSLATIRQPFYIINSLLLYTKIGDMGQSEKTGDVIYGWPLHYIVFLGVYSTNSKESHKWSGTKLIQREYKRKFKICVIKSGFERASLPFKWCLVSF